MLFYTLLFVLVGVIFKLLLNEKLLYPAIWITTIFWAFAFGPWAVLTFFELLIGVTIVESMKSNTNTNNKKSAQNQNTPNLIKAHVVPKSKSDVVVNETSRFTVKDNDFNIDINKLHNAYKKELNKNNW
jgi:hypothetical protein